MSEIGSRQDAIRMWRNRLANREDLELLREFSPELPPADQQFLASYLESRFSIYEIAEIHRTRRCAVRRRIRSLVRRLRHPLFRATILYSQEIPPDLAAIMRARYVQGKRMVELQNDFGLSDARVRRRVRDGGFFLAGASLRAAGHPQLGALLVACGVTKTRRIVESERVLCFGRAKDASPR